MSLAPNQEENHLPETGALQVRAFTELLTHADQFSPVLHERIIKPCIILHSPDKLHIQIRLVNVAQERYYQA